MMNTATVSLAVTPTVVSTLLAHVSRPSFRVSSSWVEINIHDKAVPEPETTGP